MLILSVTSATKDHKAFVSRDRWIESLYTSVLYFCFLVIRSVVLGIFPTSSLPQATRCQSLPAPIVSDKDLTTCTLPLLLFPLVFLTIHLTFIWILPNETRPSHRKPEYVQHFSRRCATMAGFSLRLSRLPKYCITDTCEISPDIFSYGQSPSWLHSPLCSPLYYRRPCIICPGINCPCVCWPCCSWFCKIPIVALKFWFSLSRTWYLFNISTALFTTITFCPTDLSSVSDRG